MKLALNGEVYLIPDELENKLLGHFEEAVMNLIRTQLTGEIKLALKIFARNYLKKAEDKARPLVCIEHAKVFRPGKGVDPIEHLAGFMLAKLKEGLIDAIGTVEWEDSEITALNFSVKDQSRTGGQVALDGDFGEREDNGAQVSGRNVYQALSYDPPLHIGYED